MARFTWGERKRRQIRIISFRKATLREQEIYFAQIRD
jgi:uncharacterized DUF497 family protein